MVLQPAVQALALLGLALSPLWGQTSPLDWPPPPALPPLPSPALRIDAAELAAALANGAAVPFDVRGAAAYEAGHLPGAVPAWSPDEEGSIDRVRSLLAARGLSGAETVV